MDPSHCVPVKAKAMFMVKEIATSGAQQENSRQLAFYEFLNPQVL